MLWDCACGGKKLVLDVETRRALDAIHGGRGGSGFTCTSGGRDCPTSPHVTCPSYNQTECDYNCVYRR